MQVQLLDSDIANRNDCNSLFEADRETPNRNRPSKFRSYFPYSMIDSVQRRLSLFCVSIRSSINLINMHWIHILKTPDAQKQPDGTWRVTTFVRILSDLSDRGTDSPVDILVELVDTKGKVLISDSVKRWRAKKYWLQPLGE